MTKETNKTAQKAKQNVINAGKFINDPAIIRETVVLWMDLLGFRGDIDIKNWDISDPKVKFAMKRIAAFHEVGVLAMNSRYTVVQLNDAIIIGRDIKDDPDKEVEEFLALVDYHFEIAAITDRELGGKGVRGVVAKGIRYNLRGNLGWLSGNNDIKEISYFCPQPVMMNTAFGRAYAVESSGELEKFSSLYVERAILENSNMRVMETWAFNRTFNIKNFGEFFLVRK